MRILTIRGANLASLKDHFEIDLTAEPLASAGLFAITGETGSGKSTILDAMCLALYDDCPRLADGGINDDVPDTAGESIKAKDARAILRRGAARGYAEVDFVGVDGTAYRARWGTRRARDKVDGRLQNVDRALIRLSDERVLESQGKRVTQRVAELTGLSFDEFRRTVLLAQGDFDAFLVAGAGERAALLEKVTGTRIYREISRRVYERYGKAKEALKALEDRHAGAMAMTEEEREALVAEGAGLLNEIKELTATIEAHARDIEAHERITAARKQADAAAVVETEARRAVGDAAQDREKLGRLEAALELRTEHDHARRARTAVSGCETQEKAAVAEQDELAEKEGRADADHRKAAAELETTEQTVKAMGPEWSRARDLDIRIRTAADEHKEAERVLNAARERTEECRKEHEALTGQRNEQISARDRAEGELALQPGAERLTEAWDTVSGLIEERTDLTRTLADKCTEAEEARVQASAAEEQITALVEANEVDKATIRDREVENGKAYTRLAEIGKTDLVTDLSRLLKGEAAMGKMIRASREYGEVQAARRQAVEGATAAEADREAAERSRLEAQAEANLASTRVKTLTAPVERAEAAVSEQAAHLRRHLEAGEPCPVCGAIEHPVSADKALADNARSIREELEEARRAQGAADRAALEADRSAETARLLIKSLTEDRTQADSRLSAVERDFAQARQEAADTGVDDLPGTPAGAAEALTALQDRIETRREGVSALVEEQSKLRKAAEGRLPIIEKLREAIERRAKEGEAQAATRSETRSKAGLAEQAARQAESRLVAIDEKLQPILTDVGRGPDFLKGTSEDARSALEDIVTRYRVRVTARDEARDALGVLGPIIAAAEAALKGAAGQDESARKTGESRGATLRALQEEREGLLGGEATEAHRERHDKALLDARTACDQARDTLSRARNDKAVVAERLSGLRSKLTEARKEDASAAEDLAWKLESTGLTVAELDALIGAGQAEAARLRGHVRTVDDALTSAISASGARRDDLESLVAAGIPDTLEEELRVARESAENARSAKQERAGSTQGRLASDDEVRGQLEDLDRQIGAAKQVCDTWTAVNEAVGSAQGDKFARIAQSVTLAMLVERANQHLAELKPRYRLARGGVDLALHIVDREMGDEIRSTRSLSGGERFLVSLALALALSRLGSHGGLAATLFIDEGFGSLDAESLDVAIDVLEALQAQGRTIGVISHVDAMKDRIPIRVHVVRRAAGASEVELMGGR